MAHQVSKKPRYEAKFLRQYFTIPGITSSCGDKYARYGYCKKDISIGHSGAFDIERHRATKTHQDY